jgi:diguanylate cyclase
LHDHSVPRPTLRDVAHAVKMWLPRGRSLPADVWQRRHRGICILLWLHLLPLLVFGVVQGRGAWHSMADIAAVPVAGVVAMRSRSRAIQSTVATIGLLTCSAVLVHLSRGTIEMHFHFFVIVGVITLYQQWMPFVVGILYVVLQHGLVGVLNPSAVYDHESAQRAPWLWALIHGGFVLAASVAHVLAWRLNEEQPSIDSLTKLPNRSLFTERLGQAVEKAGSGEELVVLFIDLDEFKAVNDTLGHAYGDELLRVVGTRLATLVRQADTVARLGGDEFAVILEGRSALDPSDIADRILRELRSPIEVRGNTLFVNASIGIVIADAGSTPEVLLRNADLAMYMAKAAGRGRFEFFNDAMSHAAQEYADLEHDLRAAVAHNQIETYFQPTVSLADGRIVALEALARWHHPTRGPIPPLRFIPIAERAGLIVDLGRRILRRACATTASLRRDHPSLTIGVNVSVHQLADDDFVRDVVSILTETGLPPSALTLEITEGVLINDVAASAARLEELRSRGIRIAIDDFGTGYSSLSYLRHLPVDTLKIDKSFIDNLDNGDIEFAAMIVRLAETLGLDVVAEGVETTPQRLRLEELGCHVGQGFLFAEPMSADQTERVLRHADQDPIWWQHALPQSLRPRTGA